MRGEARVKASQIGTDRRSRSKVWVRIVESRSIGWLEVLEAWGANVEAVVLEFPEKLKDTRQLVSSVPTITPQKALVLPPLGLWDGCMFGHLLTAQDSHLVGSLIKRWQPAIIVLSIHSSCSRAEASALLPIGVPAFYTKRMLTCCHTAVGGVTSASRRFVHYTRWPDVESYPLLMTSDTLPRTLQTALADTYGASPGGAFELREGMIPPEAIGMLASSTP
jgi:hypothetical protein